MAAKVDLELLGVIENMSGFTTPDGQRFTIFGEGGGQSSPTSSSVPLLGKCRSGGAASTPTPGSRWSSTSPTIRLAGDPPAAARDHRRDAQELASDAGRIAAAPARAPELRGQVPVVQVQG